MHRALPAAGDLVGVGRPPAARRRPRSCAPLGHEERTETLPRALRQVWRPALRAADGILPQIEGCLASALRRFRSREAMNGVTDDLRRGPSRAPRQGTDHTLGL